MTIRLVLISVTFATQINILSHFGVTETNQSLCLEAGLFKEPDLVCDGVFT